MNTEFLGIDRRIVFSAEEVGNRLLTPYYHLSGKSPRYYQAIAINLAVLCILQGRKRVLLTLAIGTGKTIIAFQICWKPICHSASAAGHAHQQDAPAVRRMNVSHRTPSISCNLQGCPCSSQLLYGATFTKTQ
jgi:hypothetical protein